MRDDYDGFKEKGAEVVVIAPDTVENAREFFVKNRLPFLCLPDPKREAFRLYDVKSAMVSLGQRPAVFVVDREGLTRFAHLGRQQWEIPTNDAVLAQLDALNAGG